MQIQKRPFIGLLMPCCISGSVSATGGHESLGLPATPNRTPSHWDSEGDLIRFNIGLDERKTLKDDLRQTLPLLES